MQCDEHYCALLSAVTGRVILKHTYTNAHGDGMVETATLRQFDEVCLHHTVLNMWTIVDDSV